jgi:membrane-bound metal-dependent hydrolase YbcI (DUF457 family)
MPLTPYHVGPALLVALLLYPVLDIPTFIVASLILDLEPLAVLLGYVNWPMHGIFHSFTAGTIVGVILALPMYLIRKYTNPIRIGKITPEERNIKNIIITSVLGVWGHVLLDSFLYADLNLFYPIQWNPLLGLISERMIINFCLISLPVAFIIYLIRSTVLTWLRPKEELYTEPDEEQVIEGIPENEPYIIFYDPESIPSGESEQEIIHEPEPEPEPEPEREPEPEYTPLPPTLFMPEPQEDIIPNEIDPDIVLGVDNTPIQWGIVGKSGLGKVAVDLNEPHIVFVCGKQGSGKGYTIGVITEMLLSKTIPKISQVKKPATIIVFHKPREDLRSEFWSIVDPNLNLPEARLLKEEYGVPPQRVITEENFRIFIDPFVYANERVKFETDYGTKAYPIAINPARLTAEDWPYVLSIGRKSGSMYVKKIFQIIKKTQYDEDFGLDKIRSHIEVSDLNPNQKSFANMRLETLQDYLAGGDFLRNLMIGGVNIFDLRKIMMEPDDIFSVMMLVISSLLNDTRTEREQFVFVINEAHDYLRKGLSKDFTDYINYLIRKKRHAGTWLMLDTHFPEDVDPKVIKGSDIKIFHKSDILSSNLLRQIVEGTTIPPHHLETGQAVIRADKSNLGPDQVLIVQVRPRLTHHGGATKTAV